MKIKLICQECKRVFFRISARSWGSKPGQYGRIRKKYCSAICANKALRRFWNTIEERKRRSKRQIGNKNSNYGNGLQKVMGYIWVNYTKPHIHKIQNRIPRAIYVMEQHLGRKLKKQEIVHHIDSNKQNDNIENLMLFKNSSEHMRWHGKRRIEKQMDYMRNHIKDK